MDTSFELDVQPENEYGSITVIQKDGVDGGVFPLLSGQEEWWIGRHPDTDICLKRTGVNDKHCCIQIMKKDESEASHKFVIVAFGPVYINGSAIATQSTPKSVRLGGTPSKSPKLSKKIIRHKDVLTIASRCFRIEYPSGHPMTVRRRSSIVKQLEEEKPISTKSPGFKSRDSMARGHNGTPLTINRISTPTGSIQKRRTLDRNDIQKNRRVTFGKALSPEIFDYRRPPATPIRKGTTPIRCDGGRRSIIKKTPLQPMREKLDVSLNLTSSFQLSPSPESSPPPAPKSPNIEEVNTEGTPSKRRRSTMFQPKKLTMDDEKPAKRERRKTTHLTPQKKLQSKLKRMSANPVELEKFLKYYGNVSSVKKAAAKVGINDENKENEEAKTPSKLPLPKINPESTPQQPQEVIVSRVEAVTPNLDTSNWSPAQSVAKMRQAVADKINPDELGFLDTPATKFAKRVLEENFAEKSGSKTTEEMVKTSEEFSFEETSHKARKSVSRASINTLDLLNSTNDETVLDVSEIQADEKEPMEDKETSKSEEQLQEPEKASAQTDIDIKNCKTPGQTAMKGLFAEGKEAQSKTPNQAAMKNLFQEESNNGNKTPGQTAMKGLFAEEKEAQSKTPNQAAMKNLFQEESNNGNKTPGQTAMKGLFAEHEDKGPQTPNQAAMKTLFKEDTVQNNKTPGQTAMKGLFAEESKAGAQTPNQAAMKTLFKEDNSNASKTPSHAGMKTLFAEQKNNDPKTPDQSAMKTLFKQAPDNQHNKTPCQGAMKDLFAENVEQGAQTPNQDAMKKLFQSDVPDVGNKTPDQSAMKGLFSEPKADVESPKLAASKELFQEEKEPKSPLLEKTVMQNVFTDDQSPMTRRKSVFANMAV